MGRGRALYAQPLFETHRLKGENRARKRKGVVEGVNVTEGQKVI